MSFDFDWGKNAVYIQGAFGFTAVILAWMIGDSLMRARRWRAKALAAERETRS